MSMNETLKLFMSHMSIRKFTDDPVEEEKVEAIIKAAQWSATSSHFQAYTIIRVNDPNKRQVLSQVAGGQKWVVESPLFLVFCADLHRGKKAWKDANPQVFSNTECLIMATVDAALAAQKAYLAAQSLGLGGVYVGGIRNDLKTVSETLKLPELVYPLFGMCLGYPDDNPGPKPRLPKEVIYKVDEYDESRDEALIAAYDRIVEEYYQNRSGGKIQDTWTARCGRTLMSKTRDDVGEFLKGIGFGRK